MLHTVHQLDAQTTADLQAFRAARIAADDPGVCHEHDPRWLAAIGEGLGHRTMAVIARDGSGAGAVTGYLPLALVSSRLFGRFLVSLPYLNRAGALANDPDTRLALLEHAAELGDRHGVQYIELRHGCDPMESPRLTQVRDDKPLMLLELPGTEESLWQGYDAKVRNQVRKAEKQDLSMRWGGEALLDAFYEVFAINMRDLGTPVYSRKLFESTLRAFAGEAELGVVEHAGQPIAAALLVHDPLRRTSQVPSASSLRAFSATNANMWMYDQLLRRAVQRGSKCFDFGRSTPGSGTWRFKKQWGAQPVPTTWQYHVRYGEVGLLRPDHPKMRRRVAAWQKLPVWVTRLVGPAIVRGIP